MHLGSFARATESLLDLGGLGQPAGFRPLALALVADPAALPTAKIVPVGAP